MVEGDVPLVIETRCPGGHIVRAYIGDEMIEENVIPPGCDKLAAAFGMARNQRLAFGATDWVVLAFYSGDGSLIETMGLER
jgi:hypothetical protein